MVTTVVESIGVITAARGCGCHFAGSSVFPAVVLECKSNVVFLSQLPALYLRVLHGTVLCVCVCVSLRWLLPVCMFISSTRVTQNIWAKKKVVRAWWLIEPPERGIGNANGRGDSEQEIQARVQMMKKETTARGHETASDPVCLLHATCLDAVAQSCRHILGYFGEEREL